MPPIKFNILLFDNLNDAKIAAKKKPINIAAAATAMVMRVAKKSSSPQPVSPYARSPIDFKAIELNYRLKN